MRIESLRYFISAANSLSFNKAAKEHFLSNSAISQQISVLEDELGCKLFKREAAGVTLTPAGAVFLESAIRIADLSDKTVNNLRHMYGKSDNLITIGFVSAVEIDLLTERVNAFKQIRPDVQVVFVQAPAQALLEKLQNESCDVVCSYGREIRSAKKIEVTPGWHDRLVLVVPKGHRLAGMGIIDSKDIPEEELILVDINSGRINIMDMIENCGEDGFTPNYKAVHSSDMMLLEVETGNGIAFCPKRSVHRMGDNVRCLDIIGGHHEIDINFYWHTNNKNKDLNDFLALCGTREG